MIIPVRCFTCGKPIGGLWEKLKEAVERGEQPGKVLDELGVDRYCCRALLLTHRDILKKIAKYRV
jgi:DNA-directed RNA polymerase subunit N